MTLVRQREGEKERDREGSRGMGSDRERKVEREGVRVRETQRKWTEIEQETFEHSATCTIVDKINTCTTAPRWGGGGGG